MSIGLMDRAAPLFAARFAIGAGLRELLQAGAAVGIKLWIILVALLQEHIALLPIREWSLSGEVMLVDQCLDRLVGLLSDGVLKAANKIGFGYLVTELCESADQ